MTPHSEKRQSQEKFLVRLPDGMRGQISLAARTKRRSMNAEIVNRLERTEVLEQLVSEQRKALSILVCRVEELEVANG